MNATRLVGTAALATLLALASASPAVAHDSLVDSNPQAGSTVTELPETISITTNEPLLTLDGGTSGFAIEVQDESGRYYGDGCMAVDGATLSTAAALGEPGTYTVTWQAVSGDGHTISDEFAFEWAPSDATEPSVGSASIPDCDGTVTTTAGETEGTASGDLAALWWIGGALVAIIAAIGIALALVGRRPKAE